MAEPVRQSTFTGGLISPEAYGRADLGKYHDGCRRLYNFMNLPHGPVINRSGSQFCGMTRLDWPHARPAGYEFSKVKLKAWEYSESDTYLTAIGHKHIRFFRNGFPLLEAGFDIAMMTTHTPMRITTSTPNLFEHMDLVYIADCEGRTMFNNRFWYVITHELQIDVLTVTPSVAPTIITTDGNHGMTDGNFYMDECVGAAGEQINQRKLAFTVPNPDEISVTGEDTSGLAAGAGGWIMRQMAPATVGTTIRLADLFGNVIDGAGLPAYTSGGRIYRVVEVRRHRMGDEQDIEYDYDDVARVNTAQSADIMPMVHRGYASRKLIRNGDTDWDIETITWGAEHSHAPGAILTVAEGAGAVVTWYVTAINAETGEESLPITNTSIDPETGAVRIRWDKVAGSSGYHVYRNDLTLRRAGFVGLQEHDSELDPATYEFYDPDDKTIEPNFDLGPPENRADIFGVDGGTDNPGVIVWHEQRLFVGSTTDEPTKVWGSGRGLYWNHNVSVPPVPDDPVAFAVAALKENWLNNMASMRDLVLVTTASEFRVNGGGDAMIEPGRIQSRPQTSNGSNYLPALMIDDTALVVTGTGNAVNAIYYSYENDGYRGQEISILAKSLFRDRTIVDWAYAKHPYSAIWLVMSDGGVVCLCFHREHKVWAWSEHVFADALAESVAAVREGNEHSVYFACKREVNSQDVRYIERLHARHFHDFDGEPDARRAFFLDAGLSYLPQIFPQDDPGYEGCTLSHVGGVLRFTFASADDPTTLFSAGDYVDLEGFTGSGNADPLVYPDQEYAFPAYVNRRQFVIAAVGATPNYIELETIDGDDLSEDMTKNWELTRCGVFRKCTNEITRGLDHLIGEDDVYMLSNGGVVGPITIEEDATYANLAQTYAMDHYASHIHIGKQIIAQFETLDAESQQNVIGHRRQVLLASSVLLRESRGHWWGPNFNDLVSFPERELEPHDVPPDLFTGWRSADDLHGDSTWSHSRLCIEQRNPLPLEIQAVVREIELGE